MNMMFSYDGDDILYERQPEQPKMDKYQKGLMKNSMKQLDTLLLYSDCNKKLALNRNASTGDLSNLNLKEIDNLKREIIRLKNEITLYLKDKIKMQARFNEILLEHKKQLNVLDSLLKQKDRIISAYDSYSKIYLSDMSILFTKVQFTYNLNEYDIGSVIRNDIQAILKKYIKFPNVFGNLDVFEKEVEKLKYKKKEEIVNYNKLKEIAQLSSNIHTTTKQFNGFTINEYETKKKDQMKTIENYNLIRMKKSSSVSIMKGNKLPTVINRELTFKVNES